MVFTIPKNPVHVPVLDAFVLYKETSNIYTEMMCQECAETYLQTVQNNGWELMSLPHYLESSSVEQCVVCDAFLNIKLDAAGIQNVLEYLVELAEKGDWLEIVKVVTVHDLEETIIEDTVIRTHLLYSENILSSLVEAEVAFYREEDNQNRLQTEEDFFLLENLFKEDPSGALAADAFRRLELKQSILILEKGGNL